MMRKLKNSVSIALNKSFYTKKSLDLCVERFTNLCKISKQEKNDRYEVRFSGLSIEDLEEISLEFANQALFFTKTGS